MRYLNFRGRRNLAPRAGVTFLRSVILRRTPGRPFEKEFRMRHCRLLCLAVAGLLAFALGSRAADKPRAEAFKPAVLLRLEPLDDLIRDARHLVKQAQREESARKVERLLKNMTGEKGFQGIDTKKPLGVYATLSPKLDQSQVVLLMPVADKKEFVEFLKGLDCKVEKGEDGVHTLTTDSIPFPILFRFAHGYA